MILTLVFVNIALLLVAAHTVAGFFAWTGKKVIDQMTKPSGKEVEETGPL